MINIVKKIKTITICAAIMVLLPLSSVVADELDELEASLKSAETEAPVKKIEEMLYPTVMVDVGQDGQGSGTIIFSGKREHESWKEEKVWTLVLTNHHVISGAIQIAEEFDPKEGKEVQKETRRPMHVRLWDYNDYSTAVGTTGRVARILAWDKHMDLALLRLSDKEITDDDVRQYGITSTIDSPILKPSLKLIYSPAIIDGKTTNIITSVSYSHFTQEIQKSYFITNLSFELKLYSYSWLKVGIRDIPEYYLRNYHDRDLSNIDYFSCTFSSQRYFASYSLPIKRFDRTWMKVYADYTKEYYNPHFTEFDLDKYL